MNISVTVGGKCQNSLDVQNLSIANDLENLSRGELWSGVGSQVEDSRQSERGWHQGTYPHPELHQLSELAGIFILQKGPEMDGELSKVTQGVKEEPGLETTGLLPLWDIHTHTLPFHENGMREA